MRIPPSNGRDPRPSLHHAPVLLFRISEQTAIAAIATAAIVASFIALAIVGWIFWRAAKRDREAEKRPDV